MINDGIRKSSDSPDMDCPALQEFLRDRQEKADRPYWAGYPDRQVQPFPAPRNRPRLEPIGGETNLMTPVRLRNRKPRPSLIWAARWIAGATLIGLLAHWHGVVR